MCLQKLLFCFREIGIQGMHIPQSTHKYALWRAHAHRNMYTSTHMHTCAQTRLTTLYLTHLHNPRARLPTVGSYIEHTVPNHIHNHAHVHSQIRPRWTNSNSCETMSKLSRMSTTRWKVLISRSLVSVWVLWMYKTTLGAHYLAVRLDLLFLGNTSGWVINVG